MKASDWNKVGSDILPVFGDIRSRSDTYLGEQYSSTLILLCKRAYCGEKEEMLVCHGHAVGFLENDSIVFFPSDETSEPESVTHWMELVLPE